MAGLCLDFCSHLIPKTAAKTVVKKKRCFNEIFCKKKVEVSFPTVIFVQCNHEPPSTTLIPGLNRSETHFECFLCNCANIAQMGHSALSRRILLDSCPLMQHTRQLSGFEPESYSGYVHSFRHILIYLRGESDSNDQLSDRQMLRTNTLAIYCFTAARKAYKEDDVLCN